MSHILPHKVDRIEAPFVVACEGYNDVCLIDQLLNQRGITNCRVGCPSRTGVGGQGKDFWTGTSPHSILQPKEKLRVLCVGFLSSSMPTKIHKRHLLLPAMPSHSRGFLSLTQLSSLRTSRMSGPPCT